MLGKGAEDPARSPQTARERISSLAVALPRDPSPSQPASALRALLFAAAIAAGCGPGEPAPTSILIVTIDTLRRDHLGCYGYLRDTSPHLDALAERSLVFEACSAPIAQTLPTHTSLFTGLYPLEHGIEANLDQAGGIYVPSPAIRTFAEVVGAAGYRTAAFVSAEPVKREGGLAAGFGTWVEPESKSVRGDVTIDKALRWLGEEATEPFFLWIHLFDPHLPYEPPPPYDTMFEADEGLDRYLAERRIPDEFRRTRGGSGMADTRTEHDRYDGEIRFTDDQLGRVFGRLDELGLWKRTAVVVTSDHGEGMAQHFTMGHGAIWREQLDVPLIVWVPGQAPRRIAEPLSSHDVLPTTLALLENVPAAAFLEQSTGRDVLAGDYAPRPIYGQLPASHKTMARSITLDGWRLIEGLDPDRLYNLTEDPFELENLAGRHPEKVRELSERLAELVREQAELGERNRAGRIREADPERRANLEALGYGGDSDGE